MTQMCSFHRCASSSRRTPAGVANQSGRRRRRGCDVIFRGDESRRRRGRDVATAEPRPRRDITPQVRHRPPARRQARAAGGRKGREKAARLDPHAGEPAARKSKQIRPAHRPYQHASSHRCRVLASTAPRRCPRTIAGIVAGPKTAFPRATMGPFLSRCRRRLQVAAPPRGATWIFREGPDRGRVAAPPRGAARDDAAAASRSFLWRTERSTRPRHGVSCGERSARRGRVGEFPVENGSERSTRRRGTVRDA